MGWELEEVEKPFVLQLKQLNWSHIEGDIDDPAVTGRTSFAEVVQEGVLREQLHALNLGQNGQPWLDAERVSEAVSALTRLGMHKLMESNQKATELLVKGLTVEGLAGWDGGRGQTIQYIDWEHPDRNEFTVVNQFRVDCPPGYNSAKAFIVPDLVLLVNGIPLVIVECKSPSIPEPLAEAVDQLRRYTNQRHADHEVDDNEGNETLFHTNQLLIATSFDEARVGTIGAAFRHYAAWKTVVPQTEEEVAAALGKPQLSEQERLIAGLLDKRTLLDVVRHFILFMEADGQTVKALCRYQQYRAVTHAIQRLQTGKTRLQDGEHDRRGGIIWHTQGSGKSLTMVFLVRKLRTDPKLRRFKVVIVTDRTDLEKQLSGTASLTNETVEKATSAHGLRRLLSAHGPGLVFGMLQKQRVGDTASDSGSADAPLNSHAPQIAEPINEDDTILVLVDEAHRSQAGDLHAALQAGLPNAARIGFTGTPILMGEKKRTHEIFGDFIDRYTIREAEADGAIVPILYEGRTANGAVKDGANLDELFEDLFRDHTAEELEAIRQKYATKGHIFEAPALIADKARDMLRHYVTNILPNGFKAQVVAYSRLAVVRYYEALLAARDELLAEAEALSPEDKALDEESLCSRPRDVQAQVQAWRYRETLQALELAPVFSGSNNDDPAWKQWTDSSAQEQRIGRFKKPLFHADASKTDALAFLIVKSMLLTGFDAPVEGVMYLDRPIREAELLQTIARVNRTGYGKQFGIVVDYFGLAHHLKEALAVYAASDIEGALQSLKDELPVLRDRHIRVVDLFRQRGIENLADHEACVEALQEERLRAEFTVKFKQFLEMLDVVLPRPEGLPFSPDAKLLAFIYARARNRYRDTPVLGKDIGAKVRKLIDDHVLSMGVDPKIPPVSLTDAEFATKVAREPNDRAKASEMEHAIRAHIREHMDQDPVTYRKLSERLRDLLARLGEQWNELAAALQGLIDQIQSGRVAHDDRLPDLPAHYGPFLRLMVDATVGEDGLTEAERQRLVDLAVEVVDMIAAELTPNFWRPTRRPAQDALSSRIFELLMRSRLLPAPQIEALVDKLIELARANHAQLVSI
ncbi:MULTISPECIES: type I restriction endonuclease subunit R [unclassified Burkholderia]|uniref:type I restriction endonuclease subunit R n=1 Tax=unclassified Burkholderia TaxID=2613784 RepID=UPI000F584FE0|nr:MULTISPECIES: type I restriction endonuclease subunit R [unclassified Burkholderia]RQR73090.1 type I restriction endonuclease subunit R [Burkholderia sp. Bp9011]RQR85072.1 type I restriction endonuclease subunit R [Burkholderia sp. Bp9010]RQS67813.1 type I restriction endonuclease subunit R [Burkholderia sp. Bp8977]